MSRHMPYPVVLALGAILGGCASVPDDRYPSLAIRDVERVTGQLDPPSARHFVPEPPAPSTLERLDELIAEAAAAHARFVDAAPAARATIEAASGAAVGAENWARAEVALADLQAIRSQTMIALADLDRIYVDAATGGTALERIAAARGEVGSLVEQESRLIEALVRTLR